MNNLEKHILEKASHIKLTLFDVDGVLTDGKMYFSETGSEYKAFHSQDGLGIKMLLRAGIKVGIISARHSSVVERRSLELGIQHVYQGQENKLIPYETIKKELELNDNAIAFIGDDLTDLAPIRRCGFGIAVANAIDPLPKYADWQTTRKGGNGAVREVCELILYARGELDKIHEHYL